MNIFERFMAYEKATEYDIDKYDFTICEQISYFIISFILIIFTAAFFFMLFITCPIWSIPYLIYKNYQLKKENK